MPGTGAFDRFEGRPHGLATVHPERDQTPQSSSDCQDDIVEFAARRVGIDRRRRGLFLIHFADEQSPGVIDLPEGRRELFRA